MSARPEAAWADEDLIRECRSGNQAAWNALIDKYKKLVYGVPARYGLPPQEAADIFQMVWTDLYRDLNRLQHARALRGWLLTATSRRCLLSKKRLAKMFGLIEAELSGAEDLSESHARSERDQLIRESVAEMTPRCRRMLEMLFFELPPRPYQQVARELGLAEGSIGFIRGRCLRKLRDVLARRGLR